MTKKKICLILDNDPHFLGGTAVYANTLMQYLRNEDICCVYPGKNNKDSLENNVRYIEIKTSLPFLLKLFEFSRKVRTFLNKEKFDIINSHAMAGYFLKHYTPGKERIVHTYHGATYYFFKNHIKRPFSFEKIMAYPLMILAKRIETPPIKYADELIFVSNKVRRQIHTLYGLGKKESVISSGVDLSHFYPEDRELCRKKLKLKKEEMYGLYIGRGGWWTKGLDRALSLAKAIRKINKNFKLIVIGSNYKKVKKLIEDNKDLVVYLPSVNRDRISKYYSACNLFLCCSRYEGGAPTLSTAEAMASGCLVVCSVDSEQEILINEQNALVINFYKANLLKEARRIFKFLGNKELINNSKKTIKRISNKRFLNEYLQVLFNK